MDVVFIVQNGRVERRAVNVSNAGTTEVEVSSGVAAGAKVIVDSPAGLVDGAKVKEARP